jgi:hypothetical protein
MSLANYRIEGYSTEKSNALSNASLASDINFALSNNKFFSEAFKNESKSTVDNQNKVSAPLTMGFSFLPSNADLSQIANMTPASSSKSQSAPQRLS